MTPEVDALANMIRAWESLPEGHHSVDNMQEWIVEKLAPAIRKCREVLPVEHRSNTTKEAIRRYQGST